MKMTHLFGCIGHLFLLQGEKCNMILFLPRMSVALLSFFLAILLFSFSVLSLSFSLLTLSRFLLKSKFTFIPLCLRSCKKWCFAEFEIVLENYAEIVCNECRKFYLTDLTAAPLPISIISLASLLNLQSKTILVFGTLSSIQSLESRNSVQTNRIHEKYIKTKLIKLAWPKKC